MKHELLDFFLKGSTCFSHCRILAENEQFIVFKHDSHYEYLNRMDGSRTCNSFAVMYEKYKLDKKDLQEVKNYLIKWEGKRLSFNYIRNCCKAEFGIDFDKDYVSEFLYIPTIPKNTLLESAKKLSSIEYNNHIIKL